MREPINNELLGGATLQVNHKDYTKRPVLKLPGSDTGLPFLAWSAGQREFTPLLLGLYWLCPVATHRRQSLQWVVVEEPEMGLHPTAIGAVLLLILELRRGYRVVISTHSPTVLDMVWAIRTCQELGGTSDDIRDLMRLPSTAQSKAIGTTALQKDYRVYFFGRDGSIRDIYGLDPGAEAPEESEWGGLTGFSGNAGSVVSRVVNRAEFRRAKTAAHADSDS